MKKLRHKTFEEWSVQRPNSPTISRDDLDNNENKIPKNNSSYISHQCFPQRKNNHVNLQKQIYRTKSMPLTINVKKLEPTPPLTDNEIQLLKPFSAKFGFNNFKSRDNDEFSVLPKRLIKTAKPQVYHSMDYTKLINCKNINFKIINMKSVDCYNSNENTNNSLFNKTWVTNNNTDFNTSSSLNSSMNSEQFLYSNNRVIIKLPFVKLSNAFESNYSTNDPSNSANFIAYRLSKRKSNSATQANIKSLDYLQFNSY